MSSLRSRKRTIPNNAFDDSDDDIQVIQIKKPRISTHKVKEKRFCYVVNFLKQSPRLKRFFTAILSTFGIDYETTMEESEDEEECNGPNLEVNNNPCAHFPSENATERLNSFRHKVKSYPNIYKKAEKLQDTFVTLPQAQNSRNVEKGNSSLCFSRKSHSMNFETKNSFHSLNLRMENSLQNLDSDHAHKLSKFKKKIVKPLKGTSNTSTTLDDQNGILNFHSAPSRLNSKFLTNAKFTSSIEQNGDDGYVIENTNGQCHKSESSKMMSIKKYEGSQNSSVTSKNFFHETLLSKNCPSYNQKVRSSFTTDEAIRIQEREQYRELVQRFSGDIWNKQKSIPSTKSVSTQANLDETLPIDHNGHFSEYAKLTPLQKSQDSLINKPPQSSESLDIVFEDLIPKNQVSLTIKDSIPSLSRNKNSNNGLYVKQKSILKLNSRKSDKINSEFMKPTNFKQLEMKNDLPEIIFEGEKPLNLYKEVGSSNSFNQSWRNKKSDLSFNTTPSELPDIICEDDDLEIFEFSKSKSHLNKNEDVVRHFPKEIAEDASSSSSLSQPFFNNRNNMENNKNTSKLESHGLFSSSWIKDLRKTVEIEAEERKRCAAEQVRQLETYKKLQANKYTKFKELLQQPDIKSKEVVCLDEEPSLPSLTPEMDAIIDQALAPHSPNEIMNTVANFTVLWKDIDTLNFSNWLNDEIINIYMFLIQERSKLANYPSVYAFTSFFYPKLKYHGYTSVKRWTRKVDIFQFDLLLVPLHLGVHWCLAVIDRRCKKIKYYDSMDTNENCLGILRDYLISEYADKKKQVFDIFGWELINMKDIPPQFNGSDCGMFTLKYAEYITRNVKINFSQQDMRYFRRKMVYEIITGQLI